GRVGGGIDGGDHVGNESGDVGGLAVRVHVDAGGAFRAEVDRLAGLVGGRLDRDDRLAGGDVEGPPVQGARDLTVEGEADRLTGPVGGDADRDDRAELARVSVWVGDVDGRGGPRP